ncbi:hypothetical protein [Rhodococcus spongiicola]|uniref:Uncharacterized protein n=1 Tax=Rhodococcus spongiicola TaxID=2487352 RepID=A0A3S3AK04_9NOCA|nr:hypothetical protein [Rhodococcus spongiicola]RVW02438.1 hypothetical protein EF834_12730 [Rhodococcus spongiicola]
MGDDRESATALRGQWRWRLISALGAAAIFALVAWWGIAYATSQDRTIEAAIDFSQITLVDGVAVWGAETRHLGFDAGYMLMLSMPADRLDPLLEASGVHTARLPISVRDAPDMLGPYLYLGDPPKGRLWRIEGESLGVGQRQRMLTWVCSPDECAMKVDAFDM